MAKIQGKVSFFLKDTKAKGLTPVRATFCYNKMQMKYYEPKLSISPKYWNSKEQKARELRDVPYASFNLTLKEIANVIIDEYQKFKLENNNLEPTVAQLRERVSVVRNKVGSTEVRTKIDLFSFLDGYLKDAYKKINPTSGKQLSTITIRAYKQTFRLLKEYRKDTNKYLDFEHIDSNFRDEFSYYLTHVKQYKLNTVGKHVRNIKTFMQEAIDRNLTDNINFRKRSFKVVSEKTDSIYLTEPELDELGKLDLSDNARLDKVRDLFLVGCWTGLRFSDLSRIQPFNIKGDFIEMDTQKTGAKAIIPIHPTVKRIMEKYKDKYPNSLPPAISNQKMNEYIKEVAEKVDLLKVPIVIGHTIRGKKEYKTFFKWQLVQTHTCRRTMATNLYLNGMPAHFIMRITAHQSEKAFLRYLKIDNKEAAQRLNTFWQSEQAKKIA